MPKARNSFNVTLQEAMEKIKAHRRSELIIRYRYLNAVDRMVTVRSLKVSTLFKDWYNECNFCPANDTAVSNVHILINPTCTALDISEDVLFGQLMDMIAAVTVGHKY